MIINTDEIKNIYVSKQFFDMRKSIDGLALIVSSQFNMNVLDHSLFIFCNASRNRIKMLYYESNGFWLFTRRLENGKFKFHKHDENGVNMITPEQLNWLIEGLEFETRIGQNSEPNRIII
ncbi:IS66 family insertion sequence element accessory protein TnpB [[Clostridium] spiroforme]|nr:IS66 family insertion sequence element accessory protein TnpB [Thomasclavelia spiroformis]